MISSKKMKEKKAHAYVNVATREVGCFNLEDLDYNDKEKLKEVIAEKDKRIEALEKELKEIKGELADTSEFSIKSVDLLAKEIKSLVDEYNAIKIEIANLNSK